MRAAILFLGLALLSWADDSVTQAGNGRWNQREFASEIDSSNVAGLRLKWNVSLCGTATCTPSVFQNKVCTTDFGGCLGCRSRDDGSVIWQKTMVDYGFPLGYYSRVTPTYIEDLNLLVVASASNKGLLNPGVPGVGAWAFALNATDGSSSWKTQVSTHLYAIVTGSPTVLGQTVYLGVSSGEAAAPLIPGYPCCSFAGRALSLRASDGAINWSLDTIPADLVGPGKYSGAAVWNGAFVVVGDHLYFGTGQLYSQPASVDACIEADPTNTSCVDERVNFNSILKVNRHTGEIVAKRRLSSADCWNIACVLRFLPGCSRTQAYDFDVTNVMVSIKNKRLYVSSKSGFLWVFDYDLNLINFDVLIPGSTSGGYVWQGALGDDSKTSKVGVYLPNNNGASRTWTLPNGTLVAGSGAWVKYDGDGNLKWATPPPFLDSVTGPLGLTNDVVFGSTRNNGLLAALDADSGAILWSLLTGKPMASGMAIVGKEVFWTTGPGTVFSATAPTQKSLLAFTL